MSINYTDLPTQFGALLQILRKYHIRLIHARDSDNANYDRRLLVQTNGFDNTDTQEQKILTRFLAHLQDSAVSSLQAEYRSFRSIIEDQGSEEKAGGLAHMIREDLGLDADELGFGMIGYQYDDQLTDGQIAIKKRRGILGALYRDMDLAANAEYITANGVTFGSFTAEDGNQGTLAVTTMTGESHALTGILKIRCTGDLVDAPEFSVELTFTKPIPDGKASRIGDNPLTAEKSWVDGNTGMTVELTRSGLAAPTEAGDDGNIFSGTSITSIKDADSNHGIIYHTVTRQAQGDTFLVEIFKDNARTEKVGRGTVNGTTGTVALSITCNGGTIFATTFHKANAATQLASAGDTDSDISFDCDSPHEGDTWTRTVTNDGAGELATRIANAWPATLPTAGSTLWTDSKGAPIQMD